MRGTDTVRFRSSRRRGKRSHFAMKSLHLTLIVGTILPSLKNILEASATLLLRAGLSALRLVIRSSVVPDRHGCSQSGPVVVA